MNSLLISLGNKKQRLPIIIIDCYVGIAVFLYFAGPIRFHSPYSFFMALYMLIFLLIINIVFFRVIWRKGNTRREVIEPTEAEKKKSSEPLPFWFYLVGMLIPLGMFVTAVLQTGFSGLTDSLTNTMAKSYTFLQSGGRYQEGIDIPMWIYMHFAIFVYLLIIDGLLFIKDNSLIRRIIWGAAVFLLLAYFILFRGAQKTLGDVFILCVSTILVIINTSGHRKRRSWRSLLVLLFMGAAFATALATIMGGRISYLNTVGYDAFRFHTRFWDVDTNYPFLALLPEKTGTGFACLVFYLCNGLCGLSYCLASPITWTYGLGTFPDLGDILGRRFGIDVYEKTYMFKAYETYGWHHSEHWHTIFPYLASDWTFLGALVVMGIITYIYAICWMEILAKKNKESIYLFCVLNILWIYLPCNNQLFSTRTTALVFIICFILWIRRDKSAIKRQTK